MEKQIYMPCKIYSGTCTPEQILFWMKLKKAIDDNGNPFFFEARKGSAHINNKATIDAAGKYALILEFVPRKHVLRIGIYIADSTKSNKWFYLLSHKEQIEEELNLSENYQPVWCIGEKNPNTKRIQTELPLYKDTDYDDLIDEALPIVMRYLKTFPKYLPDLFQ